MPEAIGALVGEPPIIIGVDLPDIIEVALIHDLRIGQADFGALDLGRLAALQGAKLRAEGDMLLVGWRFVMANHANRIGRKRGAHVPHRGLIHGLANIHACQAGRVEGVQGFYPDGHCRSPLKFFIA